MNAPESQPFFRKAALNRLSDSDQLDQLLVTANPGDWLTVLGILAVAIAALAWSFVARVETQVAGKGILVARGGAIFAPVAEGDGLVVSLDAAPGQRVAAGQRLARVAQPALLQQFAAARAVVAEQERLLASRRGQVGRFAVARQRSDASQQALLVQQRADAEVRVGAAAEQLAAGRSLLARGIVTRVRVAELERDLALARQAVSGAGGDLIRLQATEVEQRNTDERDLRVLENGLSEARRQLGAVAQELDRKQWVVSPVTGRVLEIKAPVGSRVSAGMPVLAIENGSAALQMILYVPPRDGKLVRAGMRANVSPSVAPREEFGTIRGRVIEVSDFPATRQAMAATLENEQLVAAFSAEGAPIVARVALKPDPASATGYAWTGGHGPEGTLSSGTLAEAKVTVRRQAPITFVLPFLRRFLGT